MRLRLGGGAGLRQCIAVSGCAPRVLRLAALRNANAKRNVSNRSFRNAEITRRSAGKAVETQHRNAKRSPTRKLQIPKHRFRNAVHLRSMAAGVATPCESTRENAETEKRNTRNAETQTRNAETQTQKLKRRNADTRNTKRRNANADTQKRAYP